MPKGGPLETLIKSGRLIIVLPDKTLLKLKIQRNKERNKMLSTSFLMFPLMGNSMS